MFASEAWFSSLLFGTWTDSTNGLLSGRYSRCAARARGALQYFLTTRALCFGNACSQQVVSSTAVPSTGQPELSRYDNPLKRQRLDAELKELEASLKS